MKAVVWVVEGTWRGCLDAAGPTFPPACRVALLHVTPSDVDEVTEAATAGLLGRASRSTGPRHRPADAGRPGGAGLPGRRGHAARPAGRRAPPARGRAEREVVAAVAQDVDLLVVARDGDRSRLGPHSLGHATRFVVDHAPCSVLLVWPDEPPGLDSIPPPPPAQIRRRDPASPAPW